MGYPKRILHVFHIMDRGGAETMIMNLYREIDRSRIQFDFVVQTDKKGAYDDEIALLGGEIFVVPGLSGLNYSKVRKAWAKFFSEHSEYEIIHSHAPGTAPIYLSEAGKKGLYRISHSHSASSGKGLASFIKHITRFGIRKNADFFISCSKEAGEYLYGKDIMSGKNHLILNNAINTKKYVFNQETRNKYRELFEVNDKKVIGHVGSFGYPKNHTFLLDVFSRIHEKDRSAVLLLVGDGVLRNEIESKIKTLKLSDSVILAGIRDDIPSVLNAMDIFVFPSHYEGFPVAMLEAEANGLKIIASDTITKEVAFKDRITYLSLDETSEKWANVIIDELYSDCSRPDFSEDIIEHGFDIESAARHLSDLYLSTYR